MNNNETEKMNDNDGDSQTSDFNVNYITFGDSHNNNDNQSNENEYEDISLNEFTNGSLSSGIPIGIDDLPNLISTSLLSTSLIISSIDPSSSSNDLGVNKIPYSSTLFSELHKKIFGKGKASQFYYKDYARILNQIFTQTPIDNQLCDKAVNSFIYFSTRKYFNSLIYNGFKYTDDTCWGNIIRSFQMIFAKFFFDIELLSYIQKTLHIEINKSNSIKNPYLYLDEGNFIKLKYELLLLFSDNPITLETVLNMHNFTTLINALPFILQDYDKGEKDNEAFCIKSMMAPLSIATICNCHRYLRRVNDIFIEGSVIEMTSSRVIELFNEIIEQFSLYEGNIALMSFDSYISEELIINKCFSKINNNDDIQLFNENMTLQYKQHEYKMKEGLKGIIFIDIILPSNKSSIESNYINVVSEVFKIRNTLGFIGNIKNSHSYMYFIGETKGHFISLNPNKHLHALQNMKEYYDEEKFRTYIPSSTNIKLISPKEISPHITLGFQFKSIFEYKELMTDLNKHILLERKLFDFHKEDSDKLDIGNDYNNNMFNTFNSPKSDQMVEMTKKNK